MSSEGLSPTPAVKRFDEPDELRTPPKSRVEIVRVGGHSFARMTFEPGWRWSECIRPIAGTEKCMLLHVGVVLSGKLTVELEDGRRITEEAGSAYVVPPGHDGWVEGEENYVAIEFYSAEEFAKE